MKRLKTSLLTGMALAVTLTGATAQTKLIDADIIHLKNLYNSIGKYPWLSAYMHQPTQVDALAEYNAKRKKPGAHYFLISGPWEKRGETALGQWTIQTISSYHDKQYGWGKSTGKPLKYGDRVYLMSRQRGFNMLDLADQPYKPMEHGANIPVFASYYRDRDDAAKGAEGKGTSAWILRKDRSDKTKGVGSDVDIKQSLYFESAHKENHFLETHGHTVKAAGWGLKNVEGNQFWISASKEPDHERSSQWAVVLSEESKKKRPAANAVAKVAKLDITKKESPWQFGYQTPTSGGFRKFDQVDYPFGRHSGIERKNNKGQDQWFSAAQNTKDKLVEISKIKYPAKNDGSVVLHPSPNKGETVELRYTAPSAGSYQISVQAEMIAAKPSGVTLDFQSPGKEKSFDLKKDSVINEVFSVELKKGDHVTIGVNHGKDGTHNADHTLVTATATEL
ncbi:MAG: hypothetical protein AAF591_17910 [Verrucomicrobiota bacterium]